MQVFSSLNYNAECSNDFWSNIIIASFLGLAGTVNMANQFLKFGELSEKHRLIATDYLILATRIDKELALTRNLRADAIIFGDEVTGKISLSLKSLTAVEREVNVSSYNNHIVDKMA